MAKTMYTNKVKVISERHYIKTRNVSVTYRIFYKDGKTRYCQGYYAITDSENIIEDMKNYLVREWSNQLLLNVGDFNGISHFKLITINGTKVNEIITRAEGKNND